MPCKVHFKDFAKISHENILFLILEIYMTAAYLFLDFNHILLCQITFRTMGTLPESGKETVVLFLLFKTAIIDNS